LSGFHLAGIIPVAGQPLDFNMPWHDSLMPIGRDFLAVERAVLECAHAGCETIWLVCNDDMQLLIRHRLGEYVKDPAWANRHYELNRSEHEKFIPIYYVPVHARDRNKRDCLGWSILYGAWTANKISGGLSTWLKPSRYYVSFPYGVYDFSIPRKHRKDISSSKQFFFSHNNKTIIDGEYLAFTFNHEDYKQLASEVRTKSTGLFKNKTRTEKLSVDERFSYRFFSLEDIFNSLSLDDTNVEEIPNYYRIDNWGDYCYYIGKEGANCKEIPRFLLTYKEWNGVGIDE
jgi:hypothetical protein